jgi:dihydroorotate dehydrogenase (NAD+) catalytic subunit
MSHPDAQISDIDLSVNLAGLTLQNPVMTASGTCGYSFEYSPFADLSRLGAFVTKSITPEPRSGNPPERIVETRAGMLNAIGLANIGLERFIDEKIPQLERLGTVVIVNVAGRSVEDYVKVAVALDACPIVSALELNVSCPNVGRKGLMFGINPQELRELTSAVRQVAKRCKLIVKLTPNVTDIAEPARAAIEGGADILSMVNTFQGMAIDVESRRPLLSNRVGGLSGPAIRPLAVCMVHQVYTRVAKDAGVPIIGMGGIQFWSDAAEFILAGASAVAVGTALFVDPTIPLKIVDGLQEYVRSQGAERLSDLVGAVEPPAHPDTAVETAAPRTAG